MNRIYKKTNVIKTYGLILIELIAVMAAVLIAVFTRFGGLGAEGNLDIYIQFGIIEAALLLLYSMLTDWNRDFFIRGYFKEILGTYRFFRGICYVYDPKGSAAFQNGTCYLYIIGDNPDFSFSYSFQRIYAQGLS